METYHSNKQFRPFQKIVLSQHSPHHNAHFNSFKLEFGYSNPKHKHQSPSPSAHELQHQIQSFSAAQYNPQMFQKHSSTFYSPRNSITKIKKEQLNLPQLPQMPYIKSGFPQRKKRTGQQQYLKFLLKFTDRSGQSPQRNNKKQEPLFDENDHRKITGPKLKMRNTLKWAKTRYCVNRDKQMGMFSQNFGLKKWGNQPSLI